MYCTIIWESSKIRVKVAYIYSKTSLERLLFNCRFQGTAHLNTSIFLAMPDINYHPQMFLYKEVLEKSFMEKTTSLPGIILILEIKVLLVLLCDHHSPDLDGVQIYAITGLSFYNNLQDLKQYLRPRDSFLYKAIWKAIYFSPCICKYKSEHDLI